MPRDPRSTGKRELVVHGGYVRPHVYLGRDRIKTSISLEPVAWEALQEIAAYQGKTDHELITQIDRDRRDLNLSAAIRVYIIEFYRARVRF